MTIVVAGERQYLKTIMMRHRKRWKCVMQDSMNCKVRLMQLKCLRCWYANWMKGMREQQDMVMEGTYLVEQPTAQSCSGMRIVLINS